MDTNQVKFKIFGMILFILGWIVIAATIFIQFKQLNNDKCMKAKFNWKNFLWTGILAFLVMDITLYLQGVLIKATTKNEIIPSFIAFCIAWIVFVARLSLRSGKFDAKVLILSLPAAIAIITSMIFLINHRKFQIGGTETDSSYTYGPGLLLFILGWVGIIFAISYVINVFLFK